MDIKDFIKHVVLQINEAVNECRAQGIYCSLPEYVTIEHGAIKLSLPLK